MRIRNIAPLVAAFFCFSVLVAAGDKPVLLHPQIKVKIEAPEFDKRLLLEKLNAHGPEHGLTFEAAESGFDYRVVFATDQEKNLDLVNGTGGTHNKSTASTSVFDAKGNELFRFTRANRVTDAGATNAVAKEIIKRLIKLR